MASEFGADVAAEIARAIRGRVGAWRFVRQFAEGWRSPLRDGDGWAEADLAAAEQRLGVRLPVAVREAYSLFGRRRDLTSLQDRLLDPHELVVEGPDDVLVFRQENQGVTSWGIPVARLGEPDPPVVFWLDEPGLRARGWRPFLDRFSLACVEMVLSESLFADPVALGDDRALDDADDADDRADVARLEERFARSAFPDIPLWAGGGVSRWFTGRDVVLREDAGTWVWVRARTAAALEATRAALPGEWLMAPVGGDQFGGGVRSQSCGDGIERGGRSPGPSPGRGLGRSCGRT